MNIIDRKEIVENDITYVVETYNNGTINKYVKAEADPPAQINQPMIDVVQRGHTEVNGTNIVISLDPVDVSRAAVSLDVQGASNYVYALTENALTITFSAPVQAWINWEVRG